MYPILKVDDLSLLHAPNIPEAEVLSEMQIKTDADMEMEIDFEKMGGLVPAIIQAGL